MPFKLHASGIFSVVVPVLSERHAVGVMSTGVLSDSSKGHTPHYARLRIVFEHGRSPALDSAVPEFQPEYCTAFESCSFDVASQD